MTPEEQASSAVALGITRRNPNEDQRTAESVTQRATERGRENDLSLLPVKTQDAAIETDAVKSQSSTNATTRQKLIVSGVDIHREIAIVDWGEARNIIGPTRQATTRDQWRKMNEECRELAHAIETNDRDEARDAIGDIVVTLIMQAQMWGFTMAECIEVAWQQIKDRKGKMVDGQFVKETQ